MCRPGAQPAQISRSPRWSMYVLKRHSDAWWLAAGQNTPMRPRRALPVSA
jgi:hypothetical protein